MDAVINFFKEFSSMLPTIKVMDIVWHNMFFWRNFRLHQMEKQI